MRSAWRPALYLAIITACVGAYLLRRDAPPPPEMGQLPRLLLQLGASPPLVAESELATEPTPWAVVLDYHQRWRP